MSLVYSSTKNIVRIDNFNYPYPTYIKSNFETKKTGVSNIFLHKPVNKDQGWQGYLCWNTPFICTYKFDNIIVNRSKLNYLIVGEKPTRKKVETAKKLKIEILNQNQFLNMLNKSR